MPRASAAVSSSALLRRQLLLHSLLHHPLATACSSSRLGGCIARRPALLLPCGCSVMHPRAPEPPPRAFHTGRRLLHDDASTSTHYDVLNIPLHASPAEVKKSFYRLSKAHHPDHNPDDETAPRRFMRISEAYAVLGHAQKRAVYDRDVMRRHPSMQRHQQGHPHPARPNASYYGGGSSSTSSTHGTSTGPAGGRPASGLSRRRGTFRGPPPSFFRPSSGDTTSNGTTTSSSHTSPHQNTAGSPPPSRSHPDTPHFDKAASERTHRRLDARHAQRRAQAAYGASLEGTGIAGGSPEPSTIGGFMIIFAAIVAGVALPGILFGGVWSAGAGGGGGGGGGNSANSGSRQSK